MNNAEIHLKRALKILTILNINHLDLSDNQMKSILIIVELSYINGFNDGMISVGQDFFISLNSIDKG